MFEIGRICLKIAGRDAGKKCVVVDILDDRYVLIDGMTRRRKVNVSHLEPLNQVVDIQKNASHEHVAQALGVEPRKVQTRQRTEKPKAVRTAKKTAKAVVEQKPKKTAKVSKVPKEKAVEKKE